jgi:opacity protein-like surface antigen
MRKNILIPVLLTIVLFSSNAQQNKVRFSVFANPCINWLQSDVKEIKSIGATLGFDAGLTLDNFFAENYAFTTGISIGSLGGSLEYEESTSFKLRRETVNTDPGANVKMKLQYITIPIGLKFKTNQIGYFTYFAHLGFTFQGNIKATATSNDASQTLDKDNISEEIGFFNMGYHFGAGTEYSLGGNTALVLGLTYTNGFIDVTKSSNDKISTSSLAIRLGLLF